MRLNVNVIMSQCFMFHRSQLPTDRGRYLSHCTPYGVLPFLQLHPKSIRPYHFTCILNEGLQTIEQLARSSIHLHTTSSDTHWILFQQATMPHLHVQPI